MSLEELRKNYPILDLFVQLAEIPSPSKKEHQLQQKILEIFNKNSINAKKDGYGNIIAKIPASKGFESVPPILLSAHMDVVGGSEPVNIRLSADKKYIETDKTRTLGADDKIGVAAGIDIAIELTRPESNIPHGPIEICFTRDEEMGMSGIKNLDSASLDSKYVLVIDAEKLGEHDIEGAGFTNVYISVYNGKGGHSGININDKTRVNAIKILSELDCRIPQGVYKQDSEKGVITSINAGVNLGGSANTSVTEMIKDAYESGKKNRPISEKYSSKNIFETINRESALNIINTDARQAYSIRSSDPENEKQLLEHIKQQVKELNSKYSGMIKIDMEVRTNVKPFRNSADNPLSRAIIKAGEKNQLKCTPSSFHAAAETHVFANEKKNSKNEYFSPILIGIADLENIHSSNEKLDWNSYVAGRKWLDDIIVSFAEDFKL